jgi:hypothetical protein
MNEIVNKKLEILSFTQSDSFNIDGLADKLNELTRLASGNDETGTVDEIMSIMNPRFCYCCGSPVKELSAGYHECTNRHCGKMHIECFSDSGGRCLIFEK